MLEYLVSERFALLAKALRLKTFKKVVAAIYVPPILKYKKVSFTPNQSRR
ncbi:hypothetical protein [Aggregatimonas sangjinii]|nr:hypothetical protein [Aggregatimonas sangjinii]